MSSSRNAHASLDEPRKEPTKCVASFKNGKRCTYNAKPGRITCDRPGHSRWENKTSNSSTHEDTAHEPNIVSNMGIDDGMTKQRTCIAKNLDGSTCTNRPRSGRTTCGIFRHKLYNDITPDEELGSGAEDNANEQGNLAVSSDHLASEQPGSGSSGNVGKIGESQVMTPHEDYDSTEDSQKVVDGEVEKSRCIAKREYRNERCDQEPEIGFQTCKIKSHRDQEPSGTHITQSSDHSAAITPWRLRDPLLSTESSNDPSLPLNATPKLSVGPKAPSTASTIASTQIMQGARPTVKTAAQADLGMARVLTKRSIFSALEALQEEENEMNRRHQDEATQSRPIHDLMDEMRLMSTKNDETYKETLRSAQEIVQGLVTVSSGQVNEERFFQEMRALKATLLESLRKQNTSSGRLDDDTLAQIKNIVLESRGDKKDRVSRREEISQEINSFKSPVEQSLGRHQPPNDSFNGNTAAEIKDVLQIIRDETEQRDNQRGDDLGRIFLEVRTLKATMMESLDKLHISRDVLHEDSSDELKNPVQQIQNNEDLERISQEIRALKATGGETFSKLHKADHSWSEYTSNENSDAAQEVRVGEVQNNKLTIKKCRRLKARRDEQYDIVDNMLRAFVAHHGQRW